MTEKRWLSPPPKTCDLCKEPIRDRFVDGATAFGWGCLCPGCHTAYGYGFGIGRGQEYTRQGTAWIKTKG